MPHHKYDCIVHKTQTGVYYDYWIEHSHADVEYVIQLEQEEQARRLVDKEGEKQRRGVALQVSEIITESIRPAWFGRGSLFVVNLLKAMRKGGNDILRTSQIRAMAVVDKFSEITKKTQASIDSTNEKIHESLIETKLKSEETSRNVQQKFRENSQNAKLKLQESSQNAKLKLQESSRDLRTKVEGALDATDKKVQSASEFADRKTKKIGEAVQGVVGMIRSASLNLIEKLKEKWIHLVSFQKRITFQHNEVLSSLIKRSRKPEEENERAFRLSSDIETFAIFNALLLSSLIKELKPEFYCPDFEPTRKYSTRLLEEIERRRRMIEDLFDRKAIENAKTAAFLINEKFCATAAVEEIPPLPAKKEIIETINVSPPPMGAAM